MTAQSQTGPAATTQSGSQPLPIAPQIYPEPNPYVYYRVTAVRIHEDRTTLTMDLVSDSGEPWQGIQAPVADLGPQALEIQPGDRFTWDGKSLDNRVPVGLQGELQQLAAKLNAMEPQKRVVSRQDAQTVQTLREGGYIFNADNYVVAVGQR